ncbi:MAG: type II toxin-antitoxin system VapC family toxin [Moorellales bacterium]
MGSDLVVLDTWAVVAWLRGEPSGVVVRELLRWAGGDEQAGDQVRQHLPRTLAQPEPLLNVVNLGEVFYLLARRKGEREARKTVEEIRACPIRIVPASEEIVFKAAWFKARYPIAYADGFALATAACKGGALVTGDPDLKSVKEVDLVWIGGSYG